MEKEYTRRLEKIEAVLDSWLPESPDHAWLERVFEPFPSGISQWAVALELVAVLGVYIGSKNAKKGDSHLFLADFMGNTAEQLGVGFLILDERAFWRKPARKGWNTYVKAGRPFQRRPPPDSRYVRKPALCSRASSIRGEGFIPHPFGVFIKV